LTMDKDSRACYMELDFSLAVARLRWGMLPDASYRVIWPSTGKVPQQFLKLATNHDTRKSMCGRVQVHVFINLSSSSPILHQTGRPKKSAARGKVGNLGMVDYLEDRLM